MNLKLMAANIAVVSLLLVSCNNSSQKQEEEEQQTKKADITQMDTTIQAFDKSTLPEEPMFDIETNMGTIRIKLYKQTPLHRDNFVKLASHKFYDGIQFHRVIRGFMIQGGDPLTKDTSMVDKYGTGGPGYTVPAEIIPELKHKKGALAAARRGDQVNPKRESSGSQFYIVEDAAACSSLDGDYTIFGETVSGLDVVDKIAAISTDRYDRPTTPVVIVSVKPVLAK